MQSRQHKRLVAISDSAVGRGLRWILTVLATAGTTTRAQIASDTLTTNAVGTVEEKKWSWHVQNTDIVQGDGGFPAKYSGSNSLNSKGEVQETVTLDLFAGGRLWRGAEAHMDFLMWQGFGLSKTFGVEAFPNVDAYKAGTETPAFTFARLFIRQSFGFGGEQEDVPDDQLTLADKQDISRLGWNDGHNETWTFTDADYSVSLGVSVKGEAWHRHDDTFGLAGIVSGASRSNREFLQAGGTDMLDGDGVLNYGSEKILETYYDFQVCTAVHMALDYQFITNPAFNRDRGPVSVFGARLHWEF
jgi:hypothetical protein